MNREIPYLRIVVAACILAIVGYAGFSIWAVLELKNETMTGDIIGTWKSFAVAAFTFWIGSSSGGKVKSETPAGTPENPLHVAGAVPGKPPVETTPSTEGDADAGLPESLK